MENAVDRTARGQIQQSLGDLGEVLERVQQTDLQAGKRSVGWYAMFVYAQAGCECGYCTAARDQRPAYLGYHRRQAIEEVGVYKYLHSELQPIKKAPVQRS